MAVPPGSRPRDGAPTARPDILIALVFFLALGAPLGAQELARPRLQGRVVRGDSAVVTGTVALHRVTPDTAGEIDSVLVSPTGTFAFDLPSVPDPGGQGEVYFASMKHLGILYFGPAVHSAVQLDSVYLIQVHDTAVVPAGGAEVPLQMRYLILEPGEEEWLVTDLFQLQQQGDRTLVPTEGGVVWSYPLPPGATDFEAGGEDLTPGAVTFSDGAIKVSQPLTPGKRQYVIRYRLEEKELALSLPGRVLAVELLIPEPAPPLEVEGLAGAAPVEMEPGVTYRRFTGSLLQDAQVRVVPGKEGRRFPTPWLAVLLAFVLAGASLWALQRGPAPAGAPAAWAPETRVEARERLLLELAELEERLGSDGLESREQTLLSQRRASLLESLLRVG